MILLLETILLYEYCGRLPISPTHPMYYFSVFHNKGVLQYSAQTDDLFMSDFLGNAVDFYEITESLGRQLDSFKSILFCHRP